MTQSQRKPIVGGNWKMHTMRESARSLAQAIVSDARNLASECEIVLCPPFTYLHTVGELIAGSNIALGAQDVYHEPEGAYTGEISTAMLLDLGVSHVIIGHSERRHVLGEDDELITKKLAATLDAELTAIFCIGETLEQREQGKTEEVCRRQLAAGLSAVSAGATDRLIIAYEPVWAIGTGRTASPEDAQSVHELIRSEVRKRYDEGTADRMRIQYGGSVKAANAASLFAQPDIDGGLIGGASLKSDEFLAIVRAAAASGSDTTTG